jgi:hypothetical protein
MVNDARKDSVLPVYNSNWVAGKIDPPSQFSSASVALFRNPAANPARGSRHRRQGESHLKKFIAIAALVLLFASFAPAQEKTYDVPGQFSFQYSDGWNKGHRKGGTEGELDWLVNTADPTASFHPVLAHADFTYDDWLRRTKNQATPERSLASKVEFATTAGDKGFKLVWNIKSPDGRALISYNYMFKGKGDSQLLLSAVVDAPSAAQFEPVFDGFAKSLVVSKSK